MKVKFLPQNIEVEASPEKSLLQIATENKIEIRSLCKGVPSCAECRVKIVKGEDSIPVPTKAELNLIGTTYTLDGRRLACQVHCFGDIEVDLSEQIDRQENQKRKIRGYKSDQQVESKAVLDTLILSETQAPAPGGPKDSNSRKR
jgi:ferredoxin, 2Fe-2S